MILGKVGSRQSAVGSYISETGAGIRNREEKFAASLMLA
jgi:hypothetical protein